MTVNRKPQISQIIETLLPILTLLFFIFYTILFFTAEPYLGFYTGRSVVMVTFDTAPASSNFQIGDKLIKVGNITQEDVDADLTVGYFNGLKPGDNIDITLDRQGEIINIQYVLPGVNTGEIFDRLNSNWFLPYIFWAGGTAVLLFLRPRSQVRTLLAMFCFITGVWLSAGMLSDKHLFDAALLLRSAVWLSVPIYLHLHWLFPAPLKRTPVWPWVILYGLFLLLAIASWWQWLPADLYMVGFIFALLGSLILLVIHAITQPAERRSLLGLLAALGIVLLPVVAVLALEIFKIDFPYAGLTALGLSALPGFYFFTLYRRQFIGTPIQKINKLIKFFVAAILAGTILCVILALSFLPTGVSIYNDTLSLVAVIILMIIAVVSFAPFLILPALADEKVLFSRKSGLTFSANRAASGLIFLLLEWIVVLLGVLLAQRAGLVVDSPAGLGLTALAVGLLTLLGYPPFRRWFERLALGMKLVPETLLNTYTERITTSLQSDTLRRLLLDEVLPSLLIRQFAQLKVQNDALQPFISLRMEAADLPLDSLFALDVAAGQGVLEFPIAGLPDWVRLVLPLRVAHQTRGYWLLGARDPDNRYPEADVQTLKSLADQTALAVVNIEQAEDLQAFYFADIGRNEAERAALAAELHDDVLNQMAVISNSLPADNVASQEAYTTAVARIRDIINGLRPAMLNYGLYAALQTLADDLNDRLPANAQGEGGPRITLSIPPSTARYARDVELSLFRIAQQACSNALQHAGCRKIEISGSLNADEARLLVQDDGRGFEGGEGLDLPRLLAGRHFGLVGMVERAALIGAELNIQSALGQGTKVSVAWLKK